MFMSKLRPGAGVGVGLAMGFGVRVGVGVGVEVGLAVGVGVPVGVGVGVEVGLAVGVGVRVGVGVGVLAPRLQAATRRPTTIATAKTHLGDISFTSFLDVRRPTCRPEYLWDWQWDLLAWAEVLHKILKHQGNVLFAHGSCIHHCVVLHGVFPASLVLHRPYQQNWGNGVTGRAPVKNNITPRARWKGPGQVVSHVYLRGDNTKRCGRSGCRGCRGRGRERTLLTPTTTRSH